MRERRTLVIPGKLARRAIAGRHGSLGVDGETGRKPMGNWINGLVDEWINGRENVLRGDQGRCRAFGVEIGADWWRLVEIGGDFWLGVAD